VLAKQARKTLKDNGNWQQEYHGNEIVAVIAMLSATRSVLLDKQKALSVAIEFIGTVEDHDNYGQLADDARKRSFRLFILFVLIRVSVVAPTSDKPAFGCLLDAIE